MNDKDQSAIDHVASVSKTHNAKMIIEWVMDGCVYDDYTDDDGNITAIRLERRIEPKPAKPAYRVYIEKSDGRTYTQDAINGNRDKTLLPEKYEWLSDWIEYDQPKEWPTPLVERIAAIDLEAAQWIVDHWDELLEDRYTLNINTRDSNELKFMFDWTESRCGYTYWKNISKQLGE